MKLGLEEMLQLLQEVEQGDPLDFADLPMDEDQLRRLVLSDLLQRDQQLQASASAEECQLIYLLSTARLVLENLLLHLQLLRLEQPEGGSDAQWQALLRRFRRGDDEAGGSPQLAGVGGVTASVPANRCR